MITLNLSIVLEHNGSPGRNENEASMYKIPCHLYCIIQYYSTSYQYNCTGVLDHSGSTATAVNMAKPTLRARSCIVVSSKRSDPLLLRTSSTSQQLTRGRVVCRVKIVGYSHCAQELTITTATTVIDFRTSQRSSPEPNAMIWKGHFSEGCLLSTA